MENSWKDFFGLRTKGYSYLIDDGSENKKSKRHIKMYRKIEKLNLKVKKTV